MRVLKINQNLRKAAVRLAAKMLQEKKEKDYLGEENGNLPVFLKQPKFYIYSFVVKKDEDSTLAGKIIYIGTNEKI